VAARRRAAAAACAQHAVALDPDPPAREPAQRPATVWPAGIGTPWRRPCRVGTVVKCTMSGRLPSITRSGFRESPSSTTTLRGLKWMRRGEKSSVKRKTTRPRIWPASSGSRAMPRSIRPKMLGATPSSTMRPRRMERPPGRSTSSNGLRLTAHPRIRGEARSGHVGQPLLAAARCRSRHWLPSMRQVLVPVASSLPVSTEVSFASAVAVLWPLWITTDSARTAPVSRKIGRRYFTSSVWVV
jgi:hypothetical protein